MLAAVAAVVGVGGFAGFNAYQNNSSTSDIQLANAEALSNDELPPVDVLCPAPSPRGGNCHEVDPMGITKDCGGMTFTSCKFNGIRDSTCAFC